ncbi:MAG: hypothetical protein KDC38_11085 [Planctomycetes bacterium]|nr:hypothetical protein [Planctomycetota bacterium]
MPRCRLAIVVLIALGSGGCRSALVEPDIARLYDRSAQEHDDARNPVIVIPGILGSRLVAGDRVVWGAFGGGAVDPQEPDDARLMALPLIRDEGERLQDLGDEVVSRGALDRIDVHLFGLQIQQRAYLYILATLGAGMYRDELLGKAGAIDYGNDHYTCFQFDYDWRRDLAHNARRLDRFIARAREQVRKHRPSGEIRFDIVAHSMGGLLSRYYLRYGTQDLPDDGALPALTWDGAENVDRLILVGTPNAGSAEAILQLVNGYAPALFLPFYDPVILGTFPSIFQLLPRDRHGPLVVDGQRVDRLYDPEFWIEQDWGLANPEYDDTLAVLLPDVEDATERRRIALLHLRKSLERAAHFHRALDAPANAPTGLEIHLFAGDAIDTVAVVAPDGDGGAEVVDRAPGDGTVLRTSALLDERVGAADWTRQLRTPIDFTAVHLLFTDHLQLTADPGFSDNVLYLLLEDPRRRPVEP